MSRDNPLAKYKLTASKRSLPQPRSQERLSSNAAINSIATSYYKMFRGAHRPSQGRRSLQSIGGKAKLPLSNHPLQHAEDLSRLIILSEVFQDHSGRELSAELPLSSKHRIHAKATLRKRKSVTPGRGSPDRLQLSSIIRRKQHTESQPAMQRDYHNGLTICPLLACRPKGVLPHKSPPRLPIYKMSREEDKEDAAGSPIEVYSPWGQDA